MQHRTATLERTFTASPAEVFAAWSDTAKRAKWNSPSDEIVIEMERDEFREGGTDIALCKYEGETVAHVTSNYHEIVPEKRILFTETIREGAAMQGASLVSVALVAKGSDTHMTVTLQTVAVDGSELLDGVNEGWTSALARLSAMFA